jgi:hypothetical protein
MEVLYQLSYPGGTDNFSGASERPTPPASRHPYAARPCTGPWTAYGPRERGAFPGASRLHGGSPAQGGRGARWPVSSSSSRLVADPGTLPPLELRLPFFPQELPSFGRRSAMRPLWASNLAMARWTPAQRLARCRSPLLRGDLLLRRRRARVHAARCSGVYAAGPRALEARDNIMTGLEGLLAPGYELAPGTPPVAARGDRRCDLRPAGRTEAVRQP